MTFYFKPPRGDIQFHRLQECVEERINYLKYVTISEDISECNDNERFKFEYLTDGSALDRTGHFMLRIFASKLDGLKNFLLHSEKALFEKRLKYLQHFEVKRELQTALRHVKEILGSGLLLPRYKMFLQNFIGLCEKIVKGCGLCQVFSKVHSLNCSKISISVPFTLCLPMVGSRMVDLKGGFALVPCGRWISLLSCVFTDHIKFGLEQLLQSESCQVIWDDDRMKHLFQIIKQKPDFHGSAAEPNTMALLAKEIDEKSMIFPPCMKNMHSILRYRHRLSHSSRFYYSLFLKEVGMPISESLQFWSQEYSQSNGKCSSCTHSWQRDYKRYVYSIKHIYGLEGSRRLYRSPHCKQVQDMSMSPSSDGGCPFASFDNDKLLNCLHQDIKSDKNHLERLFEVKDKESPVEACKLYCKMLHCVVKKNSHLAGTERISGKEEDTLSALYPSKFYKYISEN
ncbi:DNA primase large subunit [Frankliniella fusca]|uniref:DNA primase large subunit n=1 Tax=Frankliniella fusca TaxID=407009 RepID=A0AAE1LAZ5_9NEOP|nr:DNA primase large subunit [Frankliniella fusca]